MSVNTLTHELRIREVEERLPIAFRWFTGNTQPPVGTDEVVFWEDRTKDVAKIIMRRKSRVYVFTAYPFDPGDVNITIELQDHAHRHATGNSTKVDVGLDPITPFSYTWLHAHLFQPTVNLVPITVDMSQAGTELAPDEEVTPLFWFRGNDIGLANNTEVTQWIEKVSGTKNLTKYGGHDGPTYFTSLQNGKGGVRKVGGQDVLGYFPGFEFNGDYTFFIVYKPTVANNISIFGNDIDTGPSGSSNIGFSVSGTIVNSALRCFYSGTEVIATASVITAPSAFCVAVYKRESNLHYGFFNGVDVSAASPPSGSNSMQVESIFCIDADSTAPVDTEILEIIGYDEALSNGTINAIFNYLNTFYALGYSAITDTAEMLLGKDGSGATQVTIDGAGQLGLGIAPEDTLHVDQGNIRVDTGSFLGPHHNTLNVDRTLVDGQYIMAPTGYEIASGMNLDLEAGSELMVL